MLSQTKALHVLLLPLFVKFFNQAIHLLPLAAWEPCADRVMLQALTPTAPNSSSAQRPRHGSTANMVRQQPFHLLFLKHVYIAWEMCLFRCP
jgi:hypothetical protein